MEPIARKRVAILRPVLTGGLLAVLFMAAALGAARAGAISSRLNTPGQVPQPAGGTPSELPATHSFGIHQDTPAARDDLLKKRPVTEGTKVPTEVPPLRAQTISPPAQTGR